MREAAHPGEIPREIDHLYTTVGTVVDLLPPLQSLTRQLSQSATDLPGIVDGSRARMRQGGQTTNLVSCVNYVRQTGFLKAAGLSFLDLGGVVAGYSVFLDDPSAAQTALAFRQAIWRKADSAWPVCGLPATLYVDNGADFAGTHIAQVCADLKVQLIHSTLGKPRGRGKIERIFGTITTELLPTLPGHIPSGDNGKPVTAPTLSLSQLDAAIGRFIIDVYHQRTHPETGQTPAERWPGSGWLPRMLESLEQLNLLLLTIATPRKVQRDGIHLFGLRYFAITLAAYVGEAVTIRYNPRDLAEIRVYHHGDYICRAVAPEIASATISMKDLQAARNQRRRQLREHLTGRRSLVDLLTHADTPATDDAGAGGQDRAPRASPDSAKPRIKLYRED